ncbi:MAG: TerB family tellurite resistance protein, partial [Helicobacter sp.]|nr:TerB family tellurite resistance protein [Helicobacter sp.]
MKDYLANPKSYGSLKKQETPEFDDPYSDFRNQNDQPFSREHAVLVGLLAKLARIDGHVCELEERLVDEILDDIAQASETPTQTKEALLQHFRYEQTNATNADDLAIEYVRLTKGEYKKRLKVVEVLLMLAYADGTLDENEREVIHDVAAYFQLSNDDFNSVYDQLAAESIAP